MLTFRVDRLINGFQLTVTLDMDTAHSTSDPRVRVSDCFKHDLEAMGTVG